MSKKIGWQKYEDMIKKQIWRGRIYTCLHDFNLLINKENKKGSERNGIKPKDKVRESDRNLGNSEQQKVGFRINDRKPWYKFSKSELHRTNLIENKNVK